MDDDDVILDRLLSAVDLVSLTSLVSEAYRAGHLEALGLAAPAPKSAKFRSILRHAREHYWRTIEAARALAAAEEEPEPPRWLADLQRQRPAPTDEDVDR